MYYKKKCIKSLKKNYKSMNISLTLIIKDHSKNFFNIKKNTKMLILVFNDWWITIKIGMAINKLLKVRFPENNIIDNIGYNIDII